VSHLASTEHDGNLDACSLLEEAQYVTLLGLVIAHINLWAELHLFDFDLDLVLASCLGLASLLILELTVIKNLAYRRLGIWSNLYEIKTVLTSSLHCIIDAKKTKLTTISVNQTARASSDFLINARTIVLGYLVHLPSWTIACPPIKNPVHKQLGDNTHR
jgi:hypothetical protein